MSKRNYLNNSEAYVDLCFWKLEIYAYGDKTIKPSDRIGNAICLTTKGLSRHSKFNGYTWKEDMIANGIESMIKGMFNFNEQEFTNPHGYMSMSAENAFLQTMEKEDRELLATYKTFLVNHREEFEDGGLINTSVDEKFVQDMADKVTEIEASIERKKQRRKLLKLKRDLSPLTQLVYGDDYIDMIDEEIKKTESFYASNKINYGERGKLLISEDIIRKELGIELGTLCVGDVVDFLKLKRQMELDENMKMIENGNVYVDITFLKVEGKNFVNIEWGN